MHDNSTLPTWHHRHEPVIPNSQKQYNDYIATTTFGSLDKYVASNDNVPQDESGASAGFGVGAERGQYIGLTRRTDIGARVVAAVEAERHGDWMQTFTGRQYWPIDPRADEVFIEDIAHSLSLQCRYAGHCILHYSVAEHSVHIARWLLREYGPLTAFYGLLHDATEAFCVDVPRPLKPSLTNYKAIEQRNWLVIAERFGLPAELPDAVHEADTRIIGDELVNMRPMEWHTRHGAPLGVHIGCWSPAIAEREFLSAFGVLDAATKDVRRAA
ncbi:hypothetical protein [Rhizobium rhizogenes]|uniref:hypothetical protein n=1 Tax=Rhizobium rhizogenes TaxID=359 RepID=UPI00068964A3|nr:hypothetical protein [Rhizobium rhizogenes]NTJ22273.1 hypothetical protein [Rhizobium rhizogenes]QUE80991.1 hypothetical protein EML492_04045 [Rhizobium rhizogenes]TQO80905.1 hypothetical protein FFE80_07355 [Rhizobium rhizogenes]TRB51499.1 hypothetical protein EXN69_26240 [Rhizobium rhizogenes]